MIPAEIVLRVDGAGTGIDRTRDLALHEGHHIEEGLTSDNVMIGIGEMDIVFHRSLDQCALLAGIVAVPDRQHLFQIAHIVCHFSSP